MLWTGPHRTARSKARPPLLAVGLLASIRAAADDARLCGAGRTLVVASLQYLGIAVRLPLRRAAVRRPRHLDGAGRHGLIVGAGLGASLLRSQAAPPDARQSTLELNPCPMCFPHLISAAELRAELRSPRDPRP